MGKLDWKRLGFIGFLLMLMLVPWWWTVDLAGEMFIIGPMILALVLPCIYDTWLDIRSTNWPWTVGVVTSYSVHKVRELEKGYWIASLILSYSVAGLHYSTETGTDVRYRKRGIMTKGHIKEDVMNEAHQRYPPGTKIPVFYNPNRPSQAVCVPGLKSIRVIYPVGALLYYLIGGYFLFDPTCKISFFVFFLLGILILMNFVLIFWGSRRCGIRESQGRAEW